MIGKCETMATVITTPVTSNRRITVPPTIANLLGGLDSGDIIIFYYESGKIIIEKSGVKA